MTDTHAVCLTANDERAVARHHQRLREGRAEQVRLVVREICAPLLGPARNGGLPAHEVLEAALAWVAGTLACQELDESAGLKVRRLGRRMTAETIVF